MFLFTDIVESVKDLDGPELAIRKPLPTSSLDGPPSLTINRVPPEGLDDVFRTIRFLVPSNKR